MPSVEYFRRQADICVRLSLIASDEEVSSRLISMAREYAAKGDALAQETAADASAAEAPATEDHDAAGEGSSGPAQP
ncbi:MAG TPA: hypothetical protein VH934_12020 [Xanthobacteraceae bacterium]|jgi:hypothetical protein